MKRYILIAIAVFSLMGVKAQNLDIDLKTTDNKWVNFQDQLGEKVTIIDFWATWCKPCVNAMPKINDIYNEFKTQGVTIIGVNVDGPRNQSKVKPLVNSLKIDYPILFDGDEELLNEMNATVLPTLYILDSKGKLVYTHEGFSPGDEKEIKEEILKLL